MTFDSSGVTAEISTGSIWVAVIIFITGHRDESIPAQSSSRPVIRYALVKPHVEDGFSSPIWDAISDERPSAP